MCVASPPPSLSTFGFELVRQTEATSYESGQTRRSIPFPAWPTRGDRRNAPGRSRGDLGDLGDLGTPRARAISLLGTRPSRAPGCRSIVHLERPRAAVRAPPGRVCAVRVASLSAPVVLRSFGQRHRSAANEPNTESVSPIPSSGRFVFGLAPLRIPIRRGSAGTRRLTSPARPGSGSRAFRRSRLCRRPGTSSCVLAPQGPTQD